jgi:hypothetical protein
MEFPISVLEQLDPLPFPVGRLRAQGPHGAAQADTGQAAAITLLVPEVDRRTGITSDATGRMTRIKQSMLLAVLS